MLRAKLAFLGSGKVGKTALVERLRTGTFTEDFHGQTEGMALSMVNLHDCLCQADSQQAGVTVASWVVADTCLGAKERLTTTT